MDQEEQMDTLDFAWAVSVGLQNQNSQNGLNSPLERLTAPECGCLHLWIPIRECLHPGLWYAQLRI